MLDLSKPKQLDQAIAIVRAIEQVSSLDDQTIRKLQKDYALEDGSMLSKPDLILLYRKLAGKHGLKPYNKKIAAQMRMKPVRTASGVATVTVLIKPFFCPGKCIFCPNDVRMPKSYLASEPGAQRAEHNYFDPYLQTYNRLQALNDMGHKVDKVELIVLGGSWSVYPLPYKIWFIKECFRALNEFKKSDDRAKREAYYQQVFEKISQKNKPALSNDSKENEQRFSDHQPDGLTAEENAYNQKISELFETVEAEVGLTDFQAATWTELSKQQVTNETTDTRCVGLVLETRPDLITQKEVLQLRRFGATKIQLGVQSLDNEVLRKNKRGHTVEQTAQAMSYLRQAGFKLHVHWMANLYGSTPDKDKYDYQKLFSDPCFKPDEIKIYPCSLVESAPLMRYYQEGLWQPYDHQELLDVLSFTLLNTPEYCRITRVVRDIPSFEIVVGNKKTNFRQIAQQHLKKLDQHSVDIRAREIRGQQFDSDDVRLELIEYETVVGRNIFSQFVVDLEDVKRILGFLRLLLPDDSVFIDELEGAAVIREVHVYGQMVGLGQEADGKAQHLGLGSKLIARAKELAQEAGYKKLAVISAIGTREYYRERGFEDSGLYQMAEL